MHYVHAESPGANPLPFRGGGFSLTNGIRGCSKVLRCIFVSFGISMGGVIVTYLMRPICKIGCILENLARKAPSFAPNWVLLAEKWYRDGSQNHAFWGIEVVEILNSTLSIPVRVFLKNCPGLPFAQDFGKAGPTAPFCRKSLKCRRPRLVCPGSWQCSAVDPSLPKTQTLGIMFLPQARANSAICPGFRQGWTYGAFLPKTPPVP